MQLSFSFAPAPRTTQAPATKPAAKRVEGLSIAEQLNRGGKVDFPKNANAIRVTFGTKPTVILKADVDTLKGAGVATAVEFGTVKNDGKGHPIRKGFAALPAARLTATQRAKTQAVNDGSLFAGVLVLSVQ